MRRPPSGAVGGYPGGCSGPASARAQRPLAQQASPVQQGVQPKGKRLRFASL